MKRETYIKTMEFFRQNKACYTALKIVYKYLPLAIFIAYPVMLVWALICARQELLRLLCVPAGVFLLVTVLRVIINEQRPYERYRVSSVFEKKTQGKSMPSRHTASAFIISMAALYLCPAAGIALLAISTLIALSRVLSGVHYARDVAVGAAISVACGIVFFFIM